MEIRIKSIELTQKDIYYIEVEYYFDKINTRFFDDNIIYNQPLLDIRKVYYSKKGQYIFTPKDVRLKEICSLRTLPVFFSEMFEFLINNSEKLNPWFRLEAMRRGYLRKDYFYFAQEIIPWLERRGSID